MLNQNDWFGMRIGLIAVAMTVSLAAPANAGPVSSHVSARADVNDANDGFDPPQLNSQGATLGALSTSDSETSNGGLTLAVSASASFASAYAGTAEININRTDTSLSGTANGFSGQGEFDYLVNLPVDATLTVDYTVTLTSTDQQTLGIARYFGITIFKLWINDNQQYELGPWSKIEPQPNPLVLTGSIDVPLTAGVQLIEIRGNNGATGDDDMETRTTNGVFNWSIDVPEPGTAVLLAPALVWLAGRRRTST